MPLPLSLTVASTGQPHCPARAGAKASWSVTRSGRLPSLLLARGAPHLDLDLERSLPAVLGIHCELCWLVHSATASLLNPGPRAFT